MKFGKYFNQLSFQATTDIGYLPASPLGYLAKLANILIRLDFLIALLTILVLLPLRYYRTDVASRHFVTINVALLVLLTCLLISAVFNLPKNWYDAGYLYALLMIIWIFFIAENFSGIFQRLTARRVYIYLACVALLSQAVFISRYLPDFLDGYAGPSIPIVTYDHGKAVNDMTTASRACDIDPVHSKNVIVDDYTYLYFHKSSQPMAITYIFYGNDATSARKFISEVDSAGMMVRCSSMPSSYMPFAKVVGSVCCICNSDLKKLPLLQ